MTLNHIEPKFYNKLVDDWYEEVLDLEKAKYHENKHIGNVKKLKKSIVFSKDEEKFLDLVVPELSGIDNRAVLRGYRVEIEDYAKELSISSVRIKNILASLEEKDVIVTLLRHNQAPDILFNPFLYCSIEYVSRDVYSCFKDSLYNPFSKCDTSKKHKKTITPKLKMNDIENTKYGERNSVEYRAWREKVLERDDYKCVLCGSEDRLDAHHKDGYKWCIDKRVDVDNGATLCRLHHKLLHSIYGSGSNTREQYEEYEHLIKTLLETMKNIEEEKSELELAYERIESTVQEDLNKMKINMYFSGYKNGCIDLIKKIENTSPSLLDKLEILLAIDGDPFIVKPRNVKSKNKVISLNANDIEAMEDVLAIFKKII